ncbi:MAG: hypothetical protein WCL00_00190 [Bacteroidota bacterium]
MPKTFILNDESRLNSYGFIVLNSGGKFDRFKSNPVMLMNHEQDDLIGRWDNLRVEGSQLMADSVFDEEDPDAKKIMGKVDRGFLKGASMGLHIISAELKSVPGLDLVPVATEWEMMEGSLAAVPSNEVCLRLYSERGEVITSKEAIKLSIDSLINKNQKDNSMEKIILTAEVATILKVSKETDVTTLNAAIMELSAREAAAVKELNDHREAQAKALVEGAITEGRLSADKKDSFMKLAKEDYKQAKDLIESIPAKQTLSDKIKTSSGKTEKREDWDYLKWAKEDPRGLAKMQAENSEEFATLKANYKPKN